MNEKQPPRAPGAGDQPVGRLRRDLGTVQSYAMLLGILIGAGIFQVTRDAWIKSGSSVVLAHLLLAPLVLATSLAYSVYLSSPLGREPGGEYTHISRTFGGHRVAFVGAWLKIIGYVGAMAYLADALAKYTIEAGGGWLNEDAHRLPLAIGSILFFAAVHVFGVRWFGRLQVAMCVLLGLSLAVLIVPGLFAIRVSNYEPVFSHGVGGFAACLPPIFFAYAGFEALAQTAGEVRDSTRRLPRIFLYGIAGTTVLYLLISLVTFGVLPGDELAASSAPMADVAAQYLPAGGTWFVVLGAIMALATSLNATMIVPSRLGVLLAQDRLAPRWIGSVHRGLGTPIPGLLVTSGAAILLLLSGQLGLALNVAVFALVILYFLHSGALLLLPRRNPELHASITVPVSRRLQCLAAVVSMAGMGVLIAVQVVEDLHRIATEDLWPRLSTLSLTSIELVVVWGCLGAVIYWRGKRLRAS